MIISSKYNLSLLDRLCIFDKSLIAALISLFISSRFANNSVNLAISLFVSLRLEILSKNISTRSFDSTNIPTPRLTVTICSTSKTFIAFLIVSEDTLYSPESKVLPFSIVPTLYVPFCIFLAISSAINKY